MAVCLSCCLKQAMEFFSFVGYRKWDAVTILLGIFVINNALTYLALTPRRTISHQTDMPACLMTKPLDNGAVVRLTRMHA